MASRLKEKYLNEVVPGLQEQFKYTNVMAIPKLDKVVINIGLGEAKENAKALESAVRDMEIISGLKALLQLFRNPFARLGGYVVFTVHGIHLRRFDFLPNTPANLVKRWARLSLERYLYKKCDRIVALTETDAADIHRLYGRHLPVAIEPNSIDRSTLRSAEGLRYGEGQFAFVCIARFEFQKGQDVLIKAIARVHETLRRLEKKTLFIGGGPFLRHIRCLAEELGVSDLVEFAGEIYDAGVYMTCGRTLIAPSRWEGMPYLLLEAVARGRRIIASDCPGNRDVLKDYSLSTMFPVEDVSSLAEQMQSAD